MLSAAKDLRVGWAAYTRHQQAPAIDPVGPYARDR
jgi:hypothetical protein